MGDVGLPIGDSLGLGAGRCPKYDHAGAEPIAGIVEKRPGADQEPLGFEVVDEVVMARGELLFAQRGRGRRIDVLVIDDPTLLALGRARGLSAHAFLPQRNPDCLTASWRT